MILSRNYRGDVDPSVIEKFITLLMEKEEEGSVTPILFHHEATFVYIKCNNLYCKTTTFVIIYLKFVFFVVVSMSRKNCNVTMVLSFLYKVVEV